jgi:hypothetical protein
MHKSALYILCFVVYAMLPPTPALSLTATSLGDQVPLELQHGAIRDSRRGNLDGVVAQSGVGQQHVRWNADAPCDEGDRRCDVLQSLDDDIRHSGDRGRQPWDVAIATGVFTAIAYFLGARLGLVLLTELEGVAVFWPASGVAAGILIALGPRARAPVAIGVIVATIAANLLGDRNLWASIFSGLCNAGEATFTAWLVARWFGQPFRLDHLNCVLGFLLAAAFGAATAAIGGAITMRLFHTTAPVLSIWSVWFASDGLGIVTSASETAEIAASIQSTDGVYFVPALTGLGAPNWEARARGTIVGLTRGSGRAQLIRATLEAMAFGTADVLGTMREVSGAPFDRLRVDGGATNNDWLMQFQADILGVPVERPDMVETTALGAAGLAGLAAGVWPSAQEFLATRQFKKFTPTMDRATANTHLAGWHRAVRAALAWARDTE